MNNFPGLGKEFGQEFSEGIVEGMVKAFGRIESDKIAAGVSSIMAKVYENFNSNFDGQATGKKIAEVMQGIIKSIDMAQIGQLFGDEMGDGVRKFAYPVAMALGDGAGYLASGIFFKTIPYVFVATVAVVGTPLTLFFLYHKAKYHIGKPALAIEIRKKNFFSSFFNSPMIQKIKNIFVKNTELAEKPIFNFDLARRIDGIRDGLSNLQKNGGNLQNIILHGPPGTGKTMTVNYLLDQLDMDYVKMSGGDLPQYIKRGEHVTELNKLMRSAKNAKRPTILFIDEAEAFAKNRSTTPPPSDERIELVSAFLNQTGTGSKNLVIIMATNCIQSMDEAVLDRIDHQIEIALPSQDERVALINKYAKEFLGNEDHKTFFSENKVASMAEKLIGFSGRRIEKLLNDILSKKGCQADNQLTNELIDQSIDDFKK